MNRLQDDKMFTRRKTPIPGLEQKLILVPMNGVNATSADKPKFYIGAKDLESCVGIAIYDPDNHVSGVANIIELASDADVLYFSPPRKERTWLDYDTAARYLINAADQQGGKKYKMFTFNVFNVNRSRRLTARLSSQVNKSFNSLRYSGKVVDHTFYVNTTFIFNTKTGCFIDTDNIIFSSQ
jgi:hypothetical protein